MTDTAFTASRPTLKVDGEERPELRDALTGMVVNLPLNGMAHGELNLTNWGLTEGAQEPGFAFQDLGLGKRIEILMGEESPVRIFDGEVTALEERYGEGAPQLILLVQDPLHRLARRRQSRVFDEQSPDDVVQAIAGDAGLSADASVSTVTATFHQINESDLAFLLRLLGRFDVSFRLVDGVLRARPEEADAEPIALDAQDSALRVRLIADLNHQPSNAVVKGFNAGTDEPVSASVSALASPPPGSTAADLLANLSWPGDEVIPQPFPRTQAEADAYAEGHFARQAKRFVSGDIFCLGEPELRAGREVELAGVSERLRGNYRVVHCVHRFDGNHGYETHLKVHRPDWGG